MKKTNGKTNGKANGNGVGRPGKFKPTAVITKLVKENPRLKGSKRAKRFAFYRTGMTVAVARKSKLVTASGLKTDVADKLIRISARA